MPLPALSVILAAAEGYCYIECTVRHLAAQTVAKTLELIIVAPSREHLNAPPEVFAAFGCHQILEVGPLRSIGSANALGVRAVNAPVVAFAEDHCFPEADWAERIIAAHAESSPQYGPWAVVGPAVLNANPGSAVSRADYWIGYGAWAWPCESQERDFLPGHNSSYKRDILLSLGPELEALLEAETVLHWKLRRLGHRLYLDSAVRTAHTNFSRWGVWIKILFLGGWVFAGARFPREALAKRALFAAASPLIPLVRLRHIFRHAAQRRMLGQLFSCFPALLVGLLVDGAGQFVGYLAGPSDAMARLAPYEFCRAKYS
jgi:hypothetical protein